MALIFLTHREGLALIEANLKTGSLRNKKAYISRRHNCFPFLSDMTRPKNKPRNSILMMCHPDLSSAFVWLKICYIQVYLFTTFWHFVWLAFVHARSSTGLGTTLESGASPRTSPETGRASAHIDVRWERAGSLQRSKELVGLGDDSIKCVSQEREIEMVTLRSLIIIRFWETAHLPLP